MGVRVSMPNVLRVSSRPISGCLARCNGQSKNKDRIQALWYVARAFH